jgi:DNA-binding response OmpR family regulator
VDPKRHLDLVRLNEQERAALFERLGTDGPTGSVPAHKNRRAHPRLEFRRPDVAVTVVHPGGGESHFQVLARNLSASGIAFIHGGYIHPTTTCRLNFRTLSGEFETLVGAVVGCRHIEGTLHEVRVHFDRTIEPSTFVCHGDTGPASAAGSDDSRKLSLSLIHLEANDVDANLLRHFLVGTDVTLRRATSIEAALARLDEGSIDGVLVEINLDGEDGTEAIRAMRGKGFTGPIIAVTAETNEEHRAAATDAGAAEILNKPYTSQDLYALLHRMSRGPEGLPDDDVLYSTLDSNEGISDMLMQFIDHAEKLGRELEHALDQQNLEQARTACLNIKGSAAGHGYEPLSAAAAEALQLIDQTMSIDDCAQRISDLSQMCRRLAMRAPSESADGGTGESDAA